MRVLDDLLPLEFRIRDRLGLLRVDLCVCFIYVCLKGKEDKRTKRLSKLKVLMLERSNLCQVRHRCGCCDFLSFLSRSCRCESCNCFGVFSAGVTSSSSSSISSTFSSSSTTTSLLPPPLHFLPPWKRPHDVRSNRTPEHLHSSFDLDNHGTHLNLTCHR